MGSRDRRYEKIEVALLVIGTAITAVWVLAVAIQSIFPTHVVPVEVHGVMIVLLPLLFTLAGRAARKQNGNGGGDQ